MRARVAILLAMTGIALASCAGPSATSQLQSIDELTQGIQGKLVEDRTVSYSWTLRANSDTAGFNGSGGAQIATNVTNFATSVQNEAANKTNEKSAIVVAGDQYYVGDFTYAASHGTKPWTVRPIRGQLAAGGTGTSVLIKTQRWLTRPLILGKSLHIDSTSQVGGGVEYHLSGSYLDLTLATLTDAGIAAPPPSPTDRATLDVPVNVTLTVDDSNKLLSADVTVPLFQGQGTGNFRYEFKGWGDPVSIAPPSADQIAS